ncbi:MAG: hypothetical protein JSS25_11675 [Proteobacteria bacterium]|nr:hypothetical protein [Pseudomonadota bacterium]
MTQRPKLPEPLRAPRAGDSGLIEVIPGANGTSDGTAQAPGIVVTPPAGSQPDPALTAPIRIPAMPNPGKPVSLVMDGVPLSVFIDVVFASELKFPVAIDKTVRERSDLVSFRVAQPTPPQNMYKLAAELLRGYGVVVEEVGGSLRFRDARAGAGGSSNYVVTRDPSRVPAGARVVVSVPLGSNSALSASNDIQAMFPPQSGVTARVVTENNTVMLIGSSEAVRQAVATIVEMDRGGTQGSIAIRPQFIDISQMASELRDVLRAQGYTVKDAQNPSGALTFVMVPSSNQLLVFGASQIALKFAADWADKLDKPSSADGAVGGAYVYTPRHTTVQSLLPVIGALVGGTMSGSPGTTPSAQQNPAARAGAAPASNAFDSTSSAGASSRSNASISTNTSNGGNQTGVQTMSGPYGQIVADPVRNILVFQGDPQRWRAMQGVLSRLDVPTRQVVIEVTIAEVSLTDEYEHGVEWAIRNMRIGNFSGPVGILSGLTPATGMVWHATSKSGNIQAALNLWAKDSHIQILSTPRIMVKSGEHASIDVGDEVPTITSQATAPDLPITGGTSSILQQVQYRKTGVLLDVQATVHSSERVDLTISQEVSQATANTTSNISSPSIKTRKASTSLTLADGQSMLLGGLIQNNINDDVTKVPLLGDIPLLGNLFKQKHKTNDRTELIMLITPYIVSDEEDARQITDVVRSRFQSGNQSLRLDGAALLRDAKGGYATPANAVPMTPSPLVTPAPDAGSATPVPAPQPDPVPARKDTGGALVPAPQSSAQKGKDPGTRP